MRTTLRPALTLLILFTLLLGGVYPSIITLIARTIFPRQSQGTLINRDGRILGSALIGQSFSDPKYFWGRPSAAVAQPDVPSISSASNLSPSNPVLLENVNKRIALLRQADPKNAKPIPADLVTSSGSGLDPHISPEAAAYQIPRIAESRKMPEDNIRELVAQYTENPTFGFLGEPRVNVLKLNLALDGKI